MPNDTPTDHPSAKVVLERLEWRPAAGFSPHLRHNEIIYALGRLGDIFGPLPFEMFSERAWSGEMAHSAHDLVAYACFEGSWRDAFMESRYRA
jgi:hypothetical protein